MLKHILFIYLSLATHLFSQESNIYTEFSQNGNLYESINENSLTIAEFNENDRCIVVDYLGKDIYKIRYKTIIGFVKAEYLYVNDDMIELVIAYEDNIRIKAIEKEKQRKKEVEDLIRKSEAEKQIQEAVQPKRKREEELSKRREDSIATVYEEEKRLQEKLELQRKEQEELNERIRDSIAKVLQEEKQKQEGLELKRKFEEEQKLSRRREDSISKVLQEEKLKQERLELKRKVEDELNKKRNDSILNMNQNKEIENEISEDSKSRNKCDYAINEFDQFYGIKIIRTNPHLFNENLTVELYRQGQKLNIFFNLSEDLGCASYLPNIRSNVKVILENGDVVTFYHSWDIDCGNFSFKGNLSSSDMERLKKSPIKSITLKGTEGSIDIIKIDYKEFFIDTLKCIE